MTPRQKSTTESPRYASGASVIVFPVERANRWTFFHRPGEAALVLILPVVRIERDDEDETIRRQLAEHFGVLPGDVWLG